MSEIENYVRVKTISDACAYLEKPDSRVIAGGTDLLLKARDMPAPVLNLIDITDIAELSGIRSEAAGVRIGAATRLGDIVRSPLLSTPSLQALVQGAVQVGSPQIRNLATLGGNLCNASPSADTSAPLLVLEARAEIESRRGRRSVPLRNSFKGRDKPPCSRRTAGLDVHPHSIPSARNLPETAPRRAMDLAVVGVAVLWRQAARTGWRASPWAQ